MAKRVQPRQAQASALRRACAARMTRFADDWDLAGDALKARVDGSAAFLSGRPVVLDATALCLGLEAVGDVRWKGFRFDRDDPNCQLRWLLTETDAIIGPLTPAQLADLTA